MLLTLPIHHWDLNYIAQYREFFLAKYVEVSNSCFAFQIIPSQSGTRHSKPNWTSLLGYLISAHKYIQQRMHHLPGKLPGHQVSAWESFLIFPCPLFFFLSTNLIWLQDLELSVFVVLIFKNISSSLLFLPLCGSDLSRASHELLHQPANRLSCLSPPSLPAHSIKKMVKHENVLFLDQDLQELLTSGKGLTVSWPLPISPVIFSHFPKCPQLSPSD